MAAGKRLEKAREEFSFRTQEFQGAASLQMTMLVPGLALLPGSQGPCTSLLSTWPSASDVTHLEGAHRLRRLRGPVRA